VVCNSPDHENTVITVQSCIYDQELDWLTSIWTYIANLTRSPDQCAHIAIRGIASPLMRLEAMPIGVATAHSSLHTRAYDLKDT
jgi:hypothetical protein